MLEYGLFGNPNTGKTTLFNALTDSYTFVGNWSGVTIEKKIGQIKQTDISLVDLPGVYALNPITQDESVATHYLLQRTADGIVDVVNAAQLKRNLLLTIELLEYGQPVLLVLNMTDVLKKQGVSYRLAKLEEAFKCPIWETNARQKDGLLAFKSAFTALDPTHEVNTFQLDYGATVEALIQAAIPLIEAENTFPNQQARWIALQFFSNNQFLKKELSKSLIEELGALCVDQKTTLDAVEELIYHVRLDFIEHTLKSAREQTTKGAQQVTALTRRIDKIAVHPLYGFILFILIFYLMFKLTFDWLGGPLSDQLDAFLSGPLANGTTQLLETFQANRFVTSLIVDGILTGVGGVLVFIPQIFVLFACISILEDSGYMARSALVMDKIMEKVGLNGKAFIPLIIGFGCNVPGIMAARTIEQPKERLITTLISPFMSCSARLPVYSLFVAAFFEKQQAIIVLSLYLLGIFVALVLAKIYSAIFKTEEGSVFIVELPEYHLPKLRIIWQGTWEKGKGFIKKAGTIIFGGTVLIWLLSYFGPNGSDVAIDQSYSALIGQVLTPFFAPLGFASWQATSAIMTGILAKEVIGSTMLVLFHASGETALIAQLSQVFSPLAAYSFLVFVLLYVPCFATIGVIKSETGTWKWAIYSIFSSLFIAYLLSFIIYQGGLLLGL